MTDRPPRRPLTRLIRDTRGATAIEYGLIVSLVVIVMVVTFILLANTTVGMWNDVSEKVVKAK